MSITTNTAPPTRQRDAERTRAEILQAAIQEFVECGYNGARIDDIAARTSTTKRMIYYYFGSKEKLYIAALERVYRTLREQEESLDLDDFDPVTAIRKLAAATFDHHESHPDFIALVNIENIHRARYLAKSSILEKLGSPALDVTARILERGYRDGVFRRQVEAIDIHMVISAFCFFRAANRYTFGTIFNHDLMDLEARDHYREMLGDLIVDYLRS